jgi:acetylornithine deacetylase/succinyl-diaminopimelate desuccinylase-like protein
MYDLLREHANYLAEKAVNFTSELVSTPSQSLCENNISEKIEKKMRELGYDKVIVDDAGNVFGIIYGLDSQPTLLLNSHMDTVSPIEKSSHNPQAGSYWEIPPYSGRIENGRIYGVGSADCKGGLAVQIYAGHLLKRSLLPLRGNLIVAATVSEENGLSLGVEQLFSKTLPDLKINIDYVILGEPTNLGLFYGHDGWAEFKIGLDSPNPDFLKDAADSVFKNFLMASQVKGLSNSAELMNISQPKFNRAQNSASIILNRRIFSDDIAGTLIENFKEFAVRNLNKQEDLKLDIKINEKKQKLYNGKEIQVRYLSNAWSTDPFSPLMDRARQALVSAKCKSMPGKWQLPKLGMGTAGSILTKRFNIPTIGYGPGNEEAAHSPNEYVEIEKIKEGLLGTSSIIHSLIGIPVFGWSTDLDF